MSAKLKRVEPWQKEEFQREMYPTMFPKPGRWERFWRGVKRVWTVLRSLPARQKPLFSDCHCMCRNYSIEQGETKLHGLYGCLCYCPLHDREDLNPDGEKRPHKRDGKEVRYYTLGA